MAEKKIIAVMGATGLQGGGLVRAIVNDPAKEFTARAITRYVNSDKAQSLKKIGAEIVEGDLDKPETIKKAFEGAYGAYCVTFYWAHFSPEKELQHAKTMIDAVKSAGMQHAIWSTLEDTRKWIPLNDNRMPTLKGKYKVPHFDAKGEADKFFIDSGVPVTFLAASYYWENLIYFGNGPKKGTDGKLAITFPLDNKKMAGIASEDIGKSALGIFKNKDKYIGKHIGVAGEHLTGNEMAEKLSKALNKEIVFNNVSPDVYRGFGFPGADDVGNMFQFYRDFDKDVNDLRNVERSRSLNPELQNFDKWLEKNKHLIPLE